MAEPLAYLLTWTCYGTWLHGDERGSVDREHNRYGHDRVTPDVRRRRLDAGQLACEPYSLDAPRRLVVERVIRDHTAHRGWRLFAMSVRTNHVHVVVVAAGTPPDKVIGEFKAWATKRLRSAGLIHSDQRVWTKHGSTRYLWNEDRVTRAIDYVERFQGEPLP